MKDACFQGVICGPLLMTARIVDIHDKMGHPRQMRTSQYYRHLAAFTGAKPIPLWRRWLILFTLIWVVALYSSQVTHLIKTIEDSRQCPKCQVERQFALDVIKPKLVTAASIRICYYVCLTSEDRRFVTSVSDSRPQGRAPPILQS